MALIKCPECGKEISDKAESCIHCGFPIQKALKKEDTPTPSATGIDASIDILRDAEKDNEIVQLGNNVSLDEHVQLLAEYGDKTKYWRAYYMAGLYYANMDLPEAKWNKAVELFEKALGCEKPDYEKTYAYLGRVKCFLANKSKSDSMFRDAIAILKKSNYFSAFSDLGDVYNPTLSKFSYSQKNYETAKDYYIKSINVNSFDNSAEKLTGSVVLSNLSVLYGDKDGLYGRAAACAYLAKMISNGQVGTKNYNVYISIVDQKMGPSWRINIEKLKKFEDIDPMIERLNGEVPIKTQTFSQPSSNSSSNSSSSKPFIPKGVVIFLLIIGLLALFGYCSGPTQYEKDYKNGIDKFNHGDFDSMTDGEKNAVDNYLKWSDEH